jgi:hypothetical protein
MLNRHRPEKGDTASNVSMLCDETLVIPKRPVTVLQISNTLTMPGHRELEEGEETTGGIAAPGRANSSPKKRWAEPQHRYM